MVQYILQNSGLKFYPEKIFFALLVDQKFAKTAGSNADKIISKSVFCPVKI